MHLRPTLFDSEDMQALTFLFYFINVLNLLNQIPSL